MKAQTSITEVWKKIKSISGKSNLTVPEALLTNNDDVATDPEEILEIFADHFEKVSGSLNYEPTFLATKDYEEKESLKFESVDEFDYNTPFNIRELENALSTCKDSAPGHDTIHYAMVFRLSTNDKSELLQLYNRIWRNGSLPGS